MLRMILGRRTLLFAGNSKEATRSGKMTGYSKGAGSNVGGIRIEGHV
jgi:hypothetical protein